MGDLRDVVNMVVEPYIERVPDRADPIEFYAELLDQLNTACTMAMSYGSWAIAHPVHDAIRKSLLWAMYRWYIAPNPTRRPTEFI